MIDGGAPSKALRFISASSEESGRVHLQSKREISSLESRPIKITISQSYSDRMIARDRAIDCGAFFLAPNAKIRLSIHQG